MRQVYPKSRCSDKGRCEEWHLFIGKKGDLRRIHTDTPYLRVMPDGFHGYAVAPKGIYWMSWPFRRAFEVFRYPSGVFGGIVAQRDRVQLGR